jgi:(p)ppGpp synthase/HD superfamily hydrolase
VAISEGRRLVSGFVSANRALLGPVPSSSEGLESLVLEQTGYQSLDDMFSHVALTMQVEEIRSMLAKVFKVPLEARRSLDVSPLQRPLYKHRAQALVQEDVVFASKSGRQALKLCPHCMPVANDTLVAVPSPTTTEAGGGDTSALPLHVVHRSECGELAYNSLTARAAEPWQWVPQGFEDLMYPSTIEIAVAKGTLYALSTAAYVLETLEIDLLNASTAVDPQRKAMLILFTVGVRDLAHLKRVMDGLLAMKGVFSVRRVLNQAAKPPYDFPSPSPEGPPDSIDAIMGMGL